MKAPLCCVSKYAVIVGSRSSGVRVFGVTERVSAGVFAGNVDA